VKLTAGLRALLEAVGPLMVVALEVQFVDADAVMGSLETAIAASEQEVLRLRAPRSAQDDKRNSAGGR
jgi:hypothetical protein